MRTLVCLTILTLACGACAHKTKTATTPTRPTAAPPPARLTTDDLRARMRIIGPTVGTLRTKLLNRDLSGATMDAQTLSTAFADVARFWQQQNRTDAVMWAQQARTAAQAVATAATANDAAKANTAATNLQSACTPCHAAYREGDVQSGFRIKPGIVAGS